ncbi:hypothetical protein HK097_002322 [Rhizophlyctis rosea]|uniref:Uncharacterized protein n=1 Tax=Rhizophlyctis rosea TaxID=64517 RepID=A0AAD5X518_9FUNG|nr:hypothetical protein HK097_002322 [Rhizophlyctis rosea]
MSPFKFVIDVDPIPKTIRERVIKNKLLKRNQAERAPQNSTLDRLPTSDDDTITDESQQRQPSHETSLTHTSITNEPANSNSPSDKGINESAPTQFTAETTAIESTLELISPVDEIILEFPPPPKRPLSPSQPTPILNNAPTPSTSEPPSKRQKIDTPPTPQTEPPPSPVVEQPQPTKEEITQKLETLQAEKRKLFALISAKANVGRERPKSAGRGDRRVGGNTTITILLLLNTITITRLTSTPNPALLTIQIPTKSYHTSSHFFFHTSHTNLTTTKTSSKSTSSAFIIIFTPRRIIIKYGSQNLAF